MTTLVTTMNSPMTTERHWLDRIIEEQAAYYGMTVEQHAKFQNEMAKFDEDNPQL